MSFLANAIRVAREKRSWTQNDLALKVQVTQGTISFWENNVEMPSLVHQLHLIELMPDILTALAFQELNLLDRIQTLERVIFNGKCGCQGCECKDDTPVTPISSFADKK